MAKRNPRYLVSLDGYDLATIPSFSKLEAVKRAKQLYPGRRGRWMAVQVEDEMYGRMPGGAELEKRLRLERRLARKRAKAAANPPRLKVDRPYIPSGSTTEEREAILDAWRKGRSTATPTRPKGDRPYIPSGSTTEERESILDAWRKGRSTKARKRNGTHIHAQSIDHLDVAKVHNPKLTLARDGIDGVEIPWNQVPYGDAAFQYAFGSLRPGDEKALYRRHASHAREGWIWKMSAAAYERSRPQQGPLRNGSKRKAVKDLYESFNGRQSRRRNAVSAPTGTPDNVAKLGRLRLIQTTDGRRWKFSGSNAPFLAADHRQKLHVVGGRYRVNPPNTDCGEISRIEYEASKPHLGQDSPAIYFHELGEETGGRPRLVIDKEGLIKIVGGEYWIEADGIHN